jgi:hypothetical protein
VALVVWWICWKRRNRSIGGWLLCYHIYLYLRAFVAVYLVTSLQASFRATAWDSLGQYSLFLISTLPSCLLVVAEVAAATALLKLRDWKIVRCIRVILGLEIVSLLLAIGINMKHFSQAVTLDMLFLFWPLIWPLIWLPYFSVSMRVQRVFKTKDWELLRGIAT